MYRSLLLFFGLLGLNMLTAHGQQTPKQFQQTTNYLLYLPPGYGQDTTQRWPLLLFLHGSGERGSDVEKVKKHGPPKLVAEGKALPFIVVSPQVESGYGWEASSLARLVRSIMKEYKVDEDRVYLTGLSMGGYGSWDLAIKNPGLFAAVAPICGGGDTAEIWKLRHTPVWDFHGAKDNVVPLSESTKMVNALKAYNKDVKLTVYPEATHDSWTETYNNDSLYQWFLSHRKFTYPMAKTTPEKLKDYEGRYVMGADTLKLAVENGALVGRNRGNQAFPLKFSGNDLFYFNEKQLEDVQFHRNKKGVVDGFVFSGWRRNVYTKIK